MGSNRLIRCCCRPRFALDLAHKCSCQHGTSRKWLALEHLAQPIWFVYVQAWRRDHVRRGTLRQQWHVVHAKSEKRKQIPTNPPPIAQAIGGGQLAYTFTVKYTGGLGAKFSLVSGSILLWLTCLRAFSKRGARYLRQWLSGGNIDRCKPSNCH
jgi:hypothetical protein